MGKDPLDVIDQNLSNLRESVRQHVAARLDAGGSIVSIAHGKVVAQAKVAGTIRETVIGEVKRPPRTYGRGARGPVRMRIADPMLAQEEAAPAS